MGMVVMNFQGLVTGKAAFAIIGVFHPIVIKSVYYIGKKVWPIFLLMGLLLIVLSLFIDNTTISAITGITGLLHYGVYMSSLSRRSV